MRNNNNNILCINIFIKLIEITQDFSNFKSYKILTGLFLINKV